MLDAEALGKQMVGVVREFVSRSVGVLTGRIETVERRLDNLPAPKEIDQELIRAEIDRQIKTMPPAKDGENGKDAVIDEEAIVQRVLKLMPEPKHGENGKDVDPEFVRAEVKKAVDALPKPQDGKSVTVDELRPVVAEVVAEAVKAIPAGQDGKSVTAEDVAPIIKAEVRSAVDALPKPQDGEKGEKGEKGEDGEDGEPGRDALQIDVLDAIDPAKKYPRATFAHWRGGIVRSYRATDPLEEGVEPEKCGWHVIIRSLADTSVDIADDSRTVTVTLTLTDGEQVKKSFSLPVMIYRGVWREGESYARFDSVTRGGSQWVLMADAQKAPPGTPNADSGWVMSVKKGEPGKAGENGVSIKGDPGEKGIPGRDGNTILHGEGPPSPSLGKIGDFYIDVTVWWIYGPKTEDGWGQGRRLRGEDGGNGSTSGGGSGGASDWGDIGGTLSDQADLQAALDAKQATLVSATNIKTVNGSSLLGAGDLTVATSPAGSTTQVQFNDAGAFAGDAGLVFDKTNNCLAASGGIIPYGDLSGSDEGWAVEGASGKLSPYTFSSGAVSAQSGMVSATYGTPNNTYVLRVAVVGSGFAATNSANTEYRDMAIRNLYLDSWARLKSYTVATLPSAATAAAGAVAYVTDSNQTLAAGIGTTVAAGGSNKHKVTSDGTNWIVG